MKISTEAVQRTFSRRQAIGTVAATLASAALIPNASAQGVATTEPYYDPEFVDKWITEWMESLSAATGTLHLGRFADAVYFLIEPIAWIPDDSQDAQAVEVPRGFVTDFASVPRLFWSVIPKDGLHTYPAIVHDYLYWVQETSRKEADQVFRYAMDDFDVPRKRVIHRGVRLGGRSAWKKNAELREEGERRVLRLFPDDPLVTWEEWKEVPDVFL